MHTFNTLHEWYNKEVEYIGWLILRIKEYQHFKEEHQSNDSDIINCYQQRLQFLMESINSLYNQYEHHDHKHDLLTLLANTRILLKFIQHLQSQNDPYPF